MDPNEPTTEPTPEPDAALGPIIGTYHVHLTLRGDAGEAPKIGPVETSIEQALEATFPGLHAKARAEHT